MVRKMISFDLGFRIIAVEEFLEDEIGKNNICRKMFRHIIYIIDL